MIERLQNNLAGIRQRISDAAHRANRSEDEIKLVAVTKYVDAETTRELVLAGCRSLGESRPQVFRDKYQRMHDLDVEWHLIGHLQRNKIKFVVPQADLIHSVDSIRLLEAIDDYASKHQATPNLLLEVNVSGEAAKHGFKESDLAHALETAQNCEHVRVCGLMGMGSWGGKQEDARREFASLSAAKDRHSDRFRSDRIQLDELSMGMTGDFEAAIAEGATIVRIGSALFEGID